MIFEGTKKSIFFWSGVDTSRERTGKGCNSINMTSGVCLDEETYAAYLRQK